MKDSLQDNRITPEDMQKTIHPEPANTVHPQMLWIILVLIALGSAVFMGLKWSQENQPSNLREPIQYTPEQKQESIDALNSQFAPIAPEEQDILLQEYFNGYSQQDGIYVPSSN